MSTTASTNESDRKQPVVDDDSDSRSNDSHDNSGNDDDTNNQLSASVRNDDETPTASVDELATQVAQMGLADNKSDNAKGHALELLNADQTNKSVAAQLMDISIQHQHIPKSLQILAEWIRSGTCQHILVLSGAGVSVAAGIPDFRTPGTGLYDNLQKYRLPYPEAVFDVQFYRRRPGPFVALAAEIWPGLKHKPTVTHCFVALLAEKGLLLRNYSQNIDGLEYLANIPADLLVECHGHFRSATCIECGAPADAADVQHVMVEQGVAPRCIHCPRRGYVKPDIVFFGEDLPQRFHRLLRGDLQQADLCLVLGTSLQVAPVSLIPERVSYQKCKRALLNRECVGDFDQKVDSLLEATSRDVFCAGDCDDSVTQLATLLGWYDELQIKYQQAQQQTTTTTTTTVTTSTTITQRTNQAKPN